MQIQGIHVGYRYREYSFNVVIGPILNEMFKCDLLGFCH